MEVDYIAVYAVVGILKLKVGVAVAVVTAAAKAATVSKCTLYRVTGARVITTDGVPPSDKADARCGQLEL